MLFGSQSSCMWSCLVGPVPASVGMYELATMEDFALDTHFTPNNGSSVQPLNASVLNAEVLDQVVHQVGEAA